VSRQIILDTETTGLEVTQGHRIIEIGCVELVNRRLTGRHFHQYINPDREVDAGAFEVHGISNAFLADKPRFHQIADAFLEFVDGADIIIHNAAFDLGFLNAELKLIGRVECTPLERVHHVIDTLQLARSRHPGQKNNLDALCKRYGVDNSQRDLHGALLDAEILADVYLAMTGGQTALSLGTQDTADSGSGSRTTGIRRLPANRAPLRVVRASEAELAAHEETLQQLAKASGGNCIWQALDSAGQA
jgi:DNA polymerase-3 subunit epsilon